MLRFLWLRAWPLRTIVWTSVSAAILFVLLIAWPDNPLGDWSSEVAMWTWVGSGFVAATLPCGRRENRKLGEAGASRTSTPRLVHCPAIANLTL